MGLKVVEKSYSFFAQIVREPWKNFILRLELGEGYYSLSQNCWDTMLSSCPLYVGVQDLVS